MRKIIFYSVGILLLCSSTYGENADDLFNRLELFYEQGRYNQAAIECKKIIEHTPQDGYAYAHLGYCYFKLKKYDHAIENFEKSIVLQSDYSDSWYYLATSLFIRKKYEQARIKFEEFIIKFPEDKYVPSAKTSIGDAYYYEDEYSLAIDKYNEVFRDYPDYDRTEHVKFWLANAHFRNKEYKTAISLLEKFANKYPESKFLIRAYSLLAVAYDKEGMPEKSIATLQKAGIFYKGLLAVIVLLILGILPLIIGIYICGKFFKKKISTPTEKTSTDIFRIKDVIFVALAVVLLPFILLMIIGKLLYGEYFIGLIPSAESLETVYTICLNTVISGIILMSIILWIVFKKYLLSKKDTGFIVYNLKSITIVPLLVIFGLKIFIIAYEYIVTNILNWHLPEQFLTTIVRSIKTYNQGLLVFISIVIIAPLVEEIIFRVFFYNAFKKYINIKWGILFSSLFFAIFHFQLAYFLPLFIIGITLAYIYERTKSIIPCVIIHALNNFVFFVFFVLESKGVNA